MRNDSKEPSAWFLEVINKYFIHALTEYHLQEGGWELRNEWKVHSEKGLANFILEFDVQKFVDKWMESALSSF